MSRSFNLRKKMCCGKQSFHAPSFGFNRHSECPARPASTARCFPCRRIDRTPAMHTRQQVWRRARSSFSCELLRHRIQPHLFHAPALSVPKSVSFETRAAQSITVTSLARRASRHDRAAVVAVVSFSVLVVPALDVALIGIHVAHSRLAFSFRASVSFLAPCGHTSNLIS